MALASRAGELLLAKALFLEAFQHSRGIGEQVGIPGEDSIAIHVFDVQPQAVAGDLVLPVLDRYGHLVAARRY